MTLLFFFSVSFSFLVINWVVIICGRIIQETMITKKKEKKTFSWIFIGEWDEMGFEMLRRRYLGISLMHLCVDYIHYPWHSNTWRSSNLSLWIKICRAGGRWNQNVLKVDCYSLYINELLCIGGWILLQSML